MDVVQPFPQLKNALHQFLSAYQEPLRLTVNRVSLSDSVLLKVPVCYVFKVLVESGSVSIHNHVLLLVCFLLLPNPRLWRFLCTANLMQNDFCDQSLFQFNLVRLALVNVHVSVIVALKWLQSKHDVLVKPLVPFWVFALQVRVVFEFAKRVLFKRLDYIACRGLGWLQRLECLLFEVAHPLVVFLNVK